MYITSLGRSCLMARESKRFRCIDVWFIQTNVERFSKNEARRNKSLKSYRLVQLIKKTCNQFSRVSHIWFISTFWRWRVVRPTLVCVSATRVQSRGRKPLFVSTLSWSSQFWISAVSPLVLSTRRTLRKSRRGSSDSEGLKGDIIIVEGGAVFFSVCSKGGALFVEQK